MENKTSIYFKYAIGEIILVVIGILIALQINNWNEQRKNKSQEVLLLKQLRKDFISNRIQFDSVKQSFVIAKKASDRILNLLPFKNRQSSLDSFNFYKKDFFLVKGFNPKNGTIKSIINSANLQLISNDSLRNRVISWEDIYKDYIEDENSMTFFVRDIGNIFRKHMDNLDKNNAMNLQFIQTIEFQNQIVLRRNSLTYLLKAIEDEKIEYYMDKIISLSKTEPND